MMLGLESNTVIGLRMLRLVNGGSGALDEMQLMVREKVHAAFESSVNLATGATAEAIIDRYRQHVAANVARLSPPA